MNSDSIFTINLKYLSRFSHQYISDIEKIDCSSYEFCQTDLNELNLKKIDGEKVQFFHSKQGAVQEAKQWFQEIENLKTIETIYIYGLGLGYIYDVAKKWLEENKNRILIFFEDDFAVMHRFLELPRAAEMLNHPQVVVQVFRTPKKSNSPKIPIEFNWICRTFARTPAVIIVLKAYEQSRTEDSQLIRLMLNVRFNEIDMNLNENNQERMENLYTNFYFNLHVIPDAYRGQNVQGKFKNIPSLICGAGSSLTKLRIQIEALKNKAIIFGAGTGMNVLNKLGIIPHFGGALDPNEESINRIMTNYAYETPYFYTNRFEYHALRGIHGPILFFRTTSTSTVQDWFEIELGIMDSMAIQAQVSTTNYLLNIAQFSGSSPIILAGVDLAYTNKSRYPKEIQAHPLDSTLQEEQIKNFSIGSGRMIPMKNAEGEEIFTRYDWITEADSYTLFSKQFPNNLLLNVTKGGLPIAEIPNLSLEEVSKKYLSKEYDFINYIHAAIQSSGKMPITREKLTEVWNTWKKSLENCSSICSEMVTSFKNQRSELIKTGIIPSTHLTDEVADALIKMDEEPAYQYLLKEMVEIHKDITYRGMHLFKWFPELFTEQNLFLKRLEFEETKSQFIKSAVELHQNIMEKAIHEIVDVVPPSSKPLEKAHGDVYSFEEGKLIIHDSELEININESFNLEKHSQELIKGEYYTLNGNFHGPSRFFNEEGKLLAEGWFYRGKRHGKNWQYYAEGSLYSLQRFKEGDWEGIQEYFYENGQKKSIIRYSKGILEGKVELFLPNGVLTREINFSEGKLHGFERAWRANGQQESESQFNMNSPIGISRKWHPNGVLKVEKTYYDSVDHYDIKVWNEAGIKIGERLYVKELGQELLQDSKDRRDALDKLKKQLDDIKSKKKER